VSQISPPIRIVLVAAIAFLGAYMLFLRPKDEVIPPADPAPNVQTGAPAVSQPGKVAQAAQGAVKASDGQLNAQESVDGVDAGEAAAGTKGTTTTSPSATTPAAPAPSSLDLAGLPKPVAKAIRHNKVLVLLFWNKKSADDKAVHAALAHVDRWHGRVSVQSASIKKISKYGRIARGVDVEQSPTVVVVDASLRATALVGFVDSDTIDQAVVDALRADGPLFTDAYLRQVDKVCVKHSNQVAAIPNFWFDGKNTKQLDARLNTFDRAILAFISDFAELKAPKKWAAFKSSGIDDLGALEGGVAQFSAAVKPTSTKAQVNAAADRYETTLAPIGKRFNHRFDAQGLYRCGSAF
jgi:hypothetical protein